MMIASKTHRINMTEIQYKRTWLWLLWRMTLEI